MSGSIGTPSSATPAPTGDAQLDRINSINIDEIRDQRMGSAGSGLADSRGGASANASAARPGQPAAPGQPTPPGQPAAPGPSGANGQPVPGVPDQAPKETPIYKKWWFYAVLAVSGYVAYELATSSSTKSQTIRREVPLAQPGGLTLLRW